MDESKLVSEFGDASHLASNPKSIFEDKTSDRTPNNISLQNLAKELISLYMAHDRVYLICISLHRYIQNGSMSKFSTMNMRTLAATIVYLGKIQYTITPSTWDTPQLDEIVRKIIKKKEKQEKFINQVKSDMFRYARRLFITENGSTPGIFEQSLKATTGFKINIV